MRRLSRSAGLAGGEGARAAAPHACMLWIFVFRPRSRMSHHQQELVFSNTAAFFEDLHALGRRNARNAHAAKSLRWRSASPHLHLTPEFMPRSEFARGDAEAKPTNAQGAQSSQSGSVMCAAKLFELIHSWSAGDKQRRRSIHVFAQTTRTVPLTKAVYA